MSTPLLIIAGLVVVASAVLGVTGTIDGSQAVTVLMTTLGYGFGVVTPREALRRDHDRP